MIKQKHWINNHWAQASIIWMLGVSCILASYDVRLLLTVPLSMLAGMIIASMEKK